MWLALLVCTCAYILVTNLHSLKLQVQARSYEIWEGSDGLEAEHQRRSLAREKKKERKYAKEIKGGNKAIPVSIQDDINIALKFNSEVELNKLVHYVGFDHLSGLQKLHNTHFDTIHCSHCYQELLGNFSDTLYLFNILSTLFCFKEVKEYC